MANFLSKYTEEKFRVKDVKCLSLIQQIKLIYETACMVQWYSLHRKNIVLSDDFAPLTPALIVWELISAEVFITYIKASIPCMVLSSILLSILITNIWNRRSCGQSLCLHGYDKSCSSIVDIYVANFFTLKKSHFNAKFYLDGLKKPTLHHQLLPFLFCHFWYTDNN